MLDIVSKAKVDILLPTDPIVARLPVFGANDWQHTALTALKLPARLDRLRLKWTVQMSVWAPEQ